MKSFCIVMLSWNKTNFDQNFMKSKINSTFFPLPNKYQVTFGLGSTKYFLEYYVE